MLGLRTRVPDEPADSNLRKSASEMPASMATTKGGFPFPKVNAMLFLVTCIS